MNVVEISGFRAPNTSSIKVRGIVLDLDGVLIDSRNYWVEAERNAVNELGGQWVPRIRGSGIQAESSAGIALLASRSGLDGYEIELAVAIEKAIESVIMRKARAMPGVNNTLQRMIAVIPVAVATNTSRRIANLMLNATGLAAYIQTMVCSDEVERSKPAPHLYTAACNRLGLSASDCLGIDNSSEGICSALEAGLSTLAFGRKVAAHEGTTGVIYRLDQLVLKQVVLKQERISEDQENENILPALVTNTCSRRDSERRH